VKRSILQIFLQKTRYLFYLLRLALPAKKLQPDTTAVIDVVIPAIEGDLDILPLCIEGVRKNVQHPLGNIYIVSPDTKKIRDFALQHQLVFTDETAVMGYTPGSIGYTTYNGLNRSGWIFQQLIKLSGKAGAGRYYLVIDADHILLKPHVFLTAAKKTILYQSAECHLPYYRNIKKILGFYPVSVLSYVAHKMLFDKSALSSLQNAIETKDGTGKSWDEVIISHLDTMQVACFSEFELYGNFLPHDKKETLPWKDKMLRRSMLADYEVLKKKYPSYSSVTFPHYLNKKAT